MFPAAGSAHQTPNKLVSKEGILVLVPGGTEQRRMANGDPASRGSHQHSSGPGRAGGSWKETLGHHLQGRWDAQGTRTTSTHVTASQMSVPNRILKMSYFITQAPPAKEDVKA